MTLNLRPAAPPRHSERRLVVGPRCHYAADGLPGLAFRRAAETRSGFWPALRHELGRARFYTGLVVAGAAFAFILLAAGFFQ